MSSVAKRNKARGASGTKKRVKSSIEKRRSSSKSKSPLTGVRGNVGIKALERGQAKAKQTSTNKWIAGVGSGLKEVVEVASQSAYASGDIAHDGWKKGGIKAAKRISAAAPGQYLVRAVKQRDFTPFEEGRFVSDAPQIKAQTDKISNPWLRLGANVGIDVFTDPATFVSGGGLGLTRTAAARSSRKLIEANRRAAAEGRRLSAFEVADLAMEARLARDTGPKVRAGIRIPGTRGRHVSFSSGNHVSQPAVPTPKLLGTSGKPVDSGGVMAALRETTKAAGNTPEWVYQGHRAVTAWGRGEWLQGNKIIDAVEREAAKAKVKPERLSLLVDDPVNFVPANAVEQALRDKITPFLDDLIDNEIAEGVLTEAQRRENYLPHVRKNQNPDLVQIGTPTAYRAEGQGFQQARQTEAKLAERLAAGEKLETDVFALMRMRLRASVKERGLQGFRRAAAKRGTRAPEGQTAEASTLAAKAEVTENRALLREQIEALDPAEVRAAVDAAETRLTQAGEALGRAKANGSKEAIAAAKAEYSTARRQRDGLARVAEKAETDGIRGAAKHPQARQADNTRRTRDALEGQPTAPIEARLVKDQAVEAATARKTSASQAVAALRAELKAAPAAEKPALRQRLRDARLAELKAERQADRISLKNGASAAQAAATAKRIDDIERVLKAQVAEVEKLTAKAVDSPAAAAESMEQWMEVSRRYEQVAGKAFDGVMLPPEVAAGVKWVEKNAVRAMNEAAARPVAVQMMVEEMARTNAGWKSLALNNPRRHIRDAMDDAVMAYIAGARNPVSWGQSALILRALQKGDGRILNKTIKYKGPDGETVEITLREVAELAEVNGALNSGAVAADIRPQQLQHGVGLRRTGLLAGKKPARPGEGALSDLSQEIANVRDNWHRLAVFMERLKAGDDVYEAGFKVTEFFYDYGDLGHAVRLARNSMVPFMTFFWKTAPMLGKLAVQRPGTIANVHKTIDNLAEAGGGDADYEAKAEYAADHFQIPDNDTLREMFGVEEGDNSLFDPSKTFRVAAYSEYDPRKLGDTMGGSLSPWISSAAALRGFDTFRGREVSETVKAPGLTARALNPAPAWLQGALGYGRTKKKDAYTGDKVPGYSGKLDTLIGNAFPPYHTIAKSFTGGGYSESEVNRHRSRVSTGLSIGPEEQDKTNFYIERFGR